MSTEAKNYKKNNPNVNYGNLTLSELNKLPIHNGFIDFKIKKTSFKMLNIMNDDSSAVKFFWQGYHDLQSLDLWFDICKDEGIYIDVGAHTGLYTMTSLKANKLNYVVSIEPYFLNMARLINNLRLNRLQNNAQTFLLAVSDLDTMSKFNINTDKTYLSKGGKIDDKGELIKTIKLDSINFDTTVKKIKGIKIDTEGEDLKALKGAHDIINKFRPKIIIEVRNENKLNIQSFLKDFNYDLFLVKDLKNSVNLKDINISKVLNIFANQN